MQQTVHRVCGCVKRARVLCVLCCVVCLSGCACTQDPCVALPRWVGVGWMYSHGVSPGWLPFVALKGLFQWLLHAVCRRITKYITGLFLTSFFCVLSPPLVFTSILCSRVFCCPLHTPPCRPAKRSLKFWRLSCGTCIN